jgi:hypothetical protein
MSRDSENIRKKPSSAMSGKSDSKSYDAKVKRVTDVGTHCPTCGKKL